LYIETYKKIKGGIRMFDVAIIGCGVVGAATAFMLSQRECSVVVLEKENDVATGATRANSAIIHAGYDPEPGTKMARLNVRGVELAQKLCKELDVPYIQNGSLVLAFDETAMWVEGLVPVGESGSSLPARSNQGAVPKST
jgi:L-2-hydroxyglutarate oxidase LhgO